MDRQREQAFHAFPGSDRRHRHLRAAGVAVGRGRHDHLRQRVGQFAFGAFGAIATHYGLTPLAASTVGFGGGVVLATPVFLFARFLYSQQASSESRASDLVGQTGRVIVTIPAGGVGQVRCRIGEELIDKIARTRQGESIPENTSVRVEEVLGETVIVARQ